MTHHHNSEKPTQIITVAAVAALVGAATAMLFTPRTGEQVRGGLKRRANTVADKAKAHFNDDDELERVIEAVRERLQQATDEAAESTKEAASTAKATTRRAAKAVADSTKDK